MRILVTGGLGFIGSNFIRYLLGERGDVRVVNLDKVSYGASLSSLRDIEGSERYAFVRGDVCDPALVSRLVEGADAVVHMAAETHVDRSIADPAPFFRSNVEGTFSLLEAVRRSGEAVRILHVSTDEVYGEIPEGSFREGDGLRPSSPYAASKAAADMFCLAYHRTYGLDVVIARCTNNFGPYQFPEKLIPKTIIRASANLQVPVYGRGRNVRDWIYVLDHCEALELLLERGRAGEVYNISSGSELTNLEVVRRVLGVMGKPEDLIALVEDRPGHDVRYSLDSSKVRALGWRPARAFDEALAETVDWYLRNEWWWRPLATERILHPTPWKLEWGERGPP